MECLIFMCCSDLILLLVQKYTRFNLLVNEKALNALFFARGPFEENCFYQVQNCQYKIIFPESQLLLIRCNIYFYYHKFKYKNCIL